MPLRRHPPILTLERAAEMLWAEDPDLVIGGCADVSAILAEVARQLGINARVSGGYVRSRSEGIIPHAWLFINDGTIFDAIAYLRRRRFKLYKTDPEGARQVIEGSMADPTCDRDYLTDLVEIIVTRLTVGPITTLRKGDRAFVYTTDAERVEVDVLDTKGHEVVVRDEYGEQFAVSAYLLRPIRVGQPMEDRTRG